MTNYKSAASGDNERVIILP